MPATRPLVERFWEKVQKSDHCWEWTAAKNGDGYGSFWDGHAALRAHRVAYELLVGPIPDGLQLDHLCRNRACVNPDHLEPVTNRVNSIRGIAPALSRRRGAEQTHCKQGHEFTPENSRVVVVNARGWTRRKCRVCDRERAARRRSRKKA